MNFCIYLFFLFCAVPDVFSDCSWSLDSSSTIIRNRKFSGYEFRIYRNVNNWLSCARLCLLRSLCKSFNFDKGNQKCEINWTSVDLVSGATLSTTEHWMYGNAKQMPQIILGDCAYHACLDYQICVPQRNGGHTCLDIDECSSARTINLASFADMTYSCNPNMVGRGNPTAICKYIDGSFQWTADFACYDTSNCYVLVDGVAVYSGTMAHTQDDQLCQNWNDYVVLQTFRYTDASLEGLTVPSMSLANTRNYCRAIKRDEHLYCPVLYVGSAIERRCRKISECN